MLHKFFARTAALGRRLRPAQIIALVFALLILAGAGLLCLPCASRAHTRTPFLTSLFTAASATCVTGLIRVDTGSYWSGFGQAVLLLLIQIGGLGFMSVACVFFFALRQKIGLRQRMLLAQALSAAEYSGVVSLVRNVLLGTLAVESAGALVLTLRFWPEFGFGRALWYGVFHSVSAFCNAGFDVLGDTAAGGSLSRYVSDPVVNLTVVALIVIGGLGFSVWGEIRRRKLSVYARLAVRLTLGLLLGGAALFALLEWNNPATLGGLSVGGKLLASLFQSATLRTAGFVTIDQSALHDVSKVLCDILMFIGGSSGSTAGGVKTVTVGVLLAFVFGTARGREHVSVLRHTISARDAANAAAIAVLVFALALGGACAISVCDALPMDACLYETISALCTVGITTGITPGLSVFPQILLILYMFFGRVGIMTISVAFLAANRAESRARYADARLLIG